MYEWILSLFRLGVLKPHTESSIHWTFSASFWSFTWIELPQPKWTHPTSSIVYKQYLHQQYSLWTYSTLSLFCHCVTNHSIKFLFALSHLIFGKLLQFYQIIPLFSTIFITFKLFYWIYVNLIFVIRNGISTKFLINNFVHFFHFLLSHPIST